MVKIDNNCLFNQPVKALDESLVGRIRLDIVIPILNRAELDHESMGNPILPRLDTRLDCRGVALLADL